MTSDATTPAKLDELMTAIPPPIEWPEEIWQELIRQGKLHYIGHGSYELPKH